MKHLNAEYAPKCWWPWWADGEGLIGESSRKAGFTAIRLRRISAKVFWRCLRPPFNWGMQSNLYNADLLGANLDGANLDGANLDGANLDGANLYTAEVEPNK